MKVNLKLQEELVKAVSNVYFSNGKPRPAFLGTNASEKSKHIIEGVVHIVNLTEQEEKFVYILVGNEEATEAFGNYDDKTYLDSFEFEVGKYSRSLLDFSLLKKIETYGSYVIISEEEYNNLK